MFFSLFPLPIFVLSRESQLPWINSASAYYRRYRHLLIKTENFRGKTHENDGTNELTLVMRPFGTYRHDDFCKQSLRLINRQLTYRVYSQRSKRIDASHTRLCIFAISANQRQKVRSIPRNFAHVTIPPKKKHETNLRGGEETATTAAPSATRLFILKFYSLHL